MAYHISEYVSGIRSRMIPVHQWIGRKIERYSWTRRGDLLIVFDDGCVGWLSGVSEGGAFRVRDEVVEGEVLTYRVQELNDVLDMYPKIDVRRALAEYEAEQDAERAVRRIKQAVDALASSTGIPRNEISDFVEYYMGGE